VHIDAVRRRVDLDAELEHGLSDVGWLTKEKPAAIIGRGLAGRVPDTERVEFESAMRKNRQKPDQCHSIPCFGSDYSKLKEDGRNAFFFQ
jgi:hypothetical protein